MAFRLPDGVTAEAAADLERACVAGGQDAMPYLTQVEVDETLLRVQREIDESGHLQAPWALDGVGRIQFSSATLSERNRPYELLLELARGKVNQLRNQTADWVQGGLVLCETSRRLIADAVRAFGKAAAQADPAQARPLAEAALRAAVVAGLRLSQAYAEQVFHVRHQRSACLDSLLSCRLSAIPGGELEASLRAACNAVSLPVPWHAIEPEEGRYEWDAFDRLVDWAIARFAVVGGPIIDFSGRFFPDWFWTSQADLHERGARLTNLADRVVRRYGDRIRTWQATAGRNLSGALATSDEELLWLTVRLVETVRRARAEVKVVVGVSQPWGEYLAYQDHTVTPFSFVDTLLRTGTRIDGLELEAVMGVSPRGNYCRDPLDLSRMLDLYVLLGAPLHVTLGYPAAAGRGDEQADPDLRANAGSWGGGFGPEDQADWARVFARVALCKPFVNCVTWAHASDAAPHLFPYCGLFDAAGAPRPALDALRQLRAEHLA